MKKPSPTTTVTMHPIIILPAASATQLADLENAVSDFWVEDRSLERAWCACTSSAAALSGVLPDVWTDIAFNAIAAVPRQ